MPTVVTKSIGSAGGRDYSTLQSWADALPANLVSGDTQQNGEVYNDSEFTGTGVVYICNIPHATTDATRFIDLYAASGQSFQDNANVRTNALKYNVSNGVGIRKTDNYTGCIKVGSQYTRVRRLQLKHDTGTLGNQYVLQIISGNGTADFSFGKDLVIEAGSSPASAVNSWQSIMVNILSIGLDSSAGGSLGDTDNASTWIGCGAVRCADKTAGGTAFLANYGTNVLQSCYCFGFSTATGGSGTWGGASKNNATNLASGLPGSSNQHSVTYNQTTPFTDANLSTRDLRSIASTSLAANGFLDATNAPNDISGTARTATPTIGVWEIASAATTPVGFYPSYADMVLSPNEVVAYH